MKLGSLNTWTRRGVIAAVGLVVVGAGARLRLKAEQAPDAPASNDAIRRLVGDAPLHPGRVRISMPEAVSNDRVVPVAVDVDSPMSESDYVAQIHVLAPDDADPVVASY
ncbi:MAG TPA: thiosulfate oxidation carrier protein SoxY, partial [Candidatus Cybelea sp.]|nr:thiosulfate oxidation carrier protein SoxY [Candidatus Cybelea sp.]